MKLIKYFESKILFFESSDFLFYNHKDGYFYPLNSINLEGDLKQFTDTSENKKYESVKDFGFIGIENLKKQKEIKYYSKKIKEKTNVNKNEKDKIYIEIGDIIYPLKEDSFYISKDKKTVEFKDDHLVYNKEKYYLTSKTIKQAYVVRGNNTSSGSDMGDTGVDEISKDLQPAETPAEPTPEETK